MNVTLRSAPRISNSEKHFLMQVDFKVFRNISSTSAAVETLSRGDLPVKTFRSLNLLFLTS